MKVNPSYGENPEPTSNPLFAPQGLKIDSDGNAIAVIRLPQYHRDEGFRGTGEFPATVRKSPFSDDG